MLQFQRGRNRGLTGLQQVCKPAGQIPYVPRPESDLLGLQAPLSGCSRMVHPVHPPARLACLFWSSHPSSLLLESSLLHCVPSPISFSVHGSNVSAVRKSSLFFCGCQDMKVPHRALLGYPGPLPTCAEMVTGFTSHMPQLLNQGWHLVPKALSREADDIPSDQVLISLFLAVSSSASLCPLTFYYQQQRKIQLYLLCMAGKVPQLHIHVYYLQVLLSTQLDLIQPRVCTLYPGPSSSGLQESVPHLHQRPCRCT